MATLSKTVTTRVRVSTSSPNKTIEELKKDLFLALEVLNGYTESEALLNWECVQGTCKCP
jgi:hypothetical protein